MGTVTSKEDKVVDGGTVSTLGLYANVTPDYDKKVVRKLITARKLAPFYKGLDEQVTSKTTPPTSLLYTVECPICFLHYPSNINYSKCCDQPICTECFVQIKRTDPVLPACCPFCVQPHFGIHLAPSETQAACHHVLTKNKITRSTSSITTIDDIRPIDKLPAVPTPPVTMETPSFEEWMVMEAVRQSLQDHQDASIVC